jgi:hypothetical protein
MPQAEASQDVRGIGKFWAAIRDDEAVAVVSMRVPNDVDFKQYQERARALLQCVSEDVKHGEIVEIAGGERVFVQRPNHANRSKRKADAPVKPKSPKIYKLARHLS